MTKPARPREACGVGVELNMSEKITRSQTRERIHHEAFQAGGGAPRADRDFS